MVYTNEVQLHSGRRKGTATKSTLKNLKNITEFNKIKTTLIIYNSQRLLICVENESKKLKKNSHTYWILKCRNAFVIAIFNPVDD